jgi:hypothetical protein
MTEGVLLLVEVEGHHVILFEVLDFPLLIDEFALFILEFLLADDPVVVDPLSLLLEVGEQLLLFLVGFLELSQFLPHGKLNGSITTLNYYDSVSLTLLA